MFPCCWLMLFCLPAELLLAPPGNSLAYSAVLPPPLELLHGRPPLPLLPAPALPPRPLFIPFIPPFFVAWAATDKLLNVGVAIDRLVNRLGSMGWLETITFRSTPSTGEDTVDGGDR